MQRKYCRTVLTCRVNTYRGFQIWLRMNYPEGKPSLTEILAEEDSNLDPQLPAVKPPSPLSASLPLPMSPLAEKVSNFSRPIFIPARYLFCVS